MSLTDGKRCGISYIGYGIYVGSQGSLDHEEVASCGITHIVSLGSESSTGVVLPGNCPQRFIESYTLDIEDEEDAPWSEIFDEQPLRTFIELALPSLATMSDEAESEIPAPEPDTRLLLFSKNGLCGGVFLALGILMLYKEHTLLQASMRVFLGRPCASLFRSALEALQSIPSSASYRALDVDREKDNKSLLDDLWKSCPEEGCGCLALNKAYMPVKEKLLPMADFTGCATDPVSRAWYDPWGIQPGCSLHVL